MKVRIGAENIEGDKKADILTMQENCVNEIMQSGSYVKSETLKL